MLGAAVGRRFVVVGWPRAAVTLIIGRRITPILLAWVCLIVGLIARLHRFPANNLPFEIPDADPGVRGRADHAQRCKNKRSDTEQRHFFCRRQTKPAIIASLSRRQGGNVASRHPPCLGPILVERSSCGWRPPGCAGRNRPCRHVSRCATSATSATSATERETAGRTSGLTPHA